VSRSSILLKVFHHDAPTFFYTLSTETVTDTRPYQAKFGFDSTHARVIHAVGVSSRVLDIGCADGYLAAPLKEKGCYIVGTDMYPIKKTTDVDEFYQSDLNQDALPEATHVFDFVLLLDVIEHLISPEKFVLQLRQSSSINQNTEVIATTGNVAFFPIRLNLLFGQFEYQDRGILDRTHTRLFTAKSFKKLFENAGFEIIEMQGVPAPFPLIFGDTLFSKFMLALNRFLILASKGLFSFQILYRLRIK
jgi:2-polyprenyl-3-methyl-5-hydroxy-6-metoxy-1,4-benzoquinol methylase